MEAEEKANRGFGWVFLRFGGFLLLVRVSLFLLFIAECINLNCMSLGKSGCAGRLGDAANRQAQRL